VQTVVLNVGQDHPVIWQSSQDHTEISTRCRGPTKKHLLLLFIKPMRHTHFDNTPNGKSILFNFQAQSHLSLQVVFHISHCIQTTLADFDSTDTCNSSTSTFFRVQQNSFNPSSDNPAFEDSSPKTTCFVFYQKKVSSLKQADLTNMFKKASKGVHTSTVVVSPNPMSPTLTSSTYEESMKQRTYRYPKTADEGHMQMDTPMINSIAKYRSNNKKLPVIIFLQHLEQLHVSHLRQT